jgi:cysteine-S-conjugate beta-lyase
VFSIVLKPEFGARVYDAMSRLRLFAIGASWGGTHSLIAPMAIAPDRSVRPWNPAEQVVRLSIGLEEPDELWSDLSGFLAALANS